MTVVSDGVLQASVCIANRSLENSAGMGWHSHHMPSLHTESTNGPFSSGGQKYNWSNTWKHACYCAFMCTFTEKHVCNYLVLTFDPTGKGSIDSTM